MQCNILADENIDFYIIKSLRTEGFRIISILEDYKGSSDKQVIEIAKLSIQLSLRKIKILVSLFFHIKFVL